ncbi:uncharacterized mitochondrial protein-like protein [Tanacetum coccineum]|uniref:Uncharacterized mitochondrial protein-like protein n=1 Tax=Tanacetum coccineum TaxID=301880 RepID=A0ABQ4XN82_9ASTR
MMDPTFNVASTNEVNAVGGKTSIELLLDPNMLELEDYSIFEDDEDVGADADMNNSDTIIQVSPIPTTRIHKDHPLDQVIRDFQSTTLTRKMPKNLEEHGFVSTIQQRINHKDLQNCLFACFLSQEEPKKVIHALKDPSWTEAIQEELLQFKLQERENLTKPYSSEGTKVILLLVQVYVDDIIFGSTKKELCNAFEKLMHEKFQMSSMGELTFFLGLQKKSKDCNTPIETQKPLLKDEDGEEVDVHMYRSMIGSLMYLTSSRPDIMFAVCACATYQVNPKVSHLHAVKRIFSARNRQWLKIPQQKLNMWLLQVAVDKCFGFIINYLIMGKEKKSVRLMTERELCKNRQSDLVRKRIERSDFLNAHPIKHALTINPTIYASCIQQLWVIVKAKTVNREVQLQALVDGKKIIITESTVRRDLQLEDAECVDCLPNATIFEQLALMGYEQSSVPSDNVADEVVYKELDDSLVRDATTTSSLEAEQDNGNITKTRSKGTLNEPSCSGTSSGSGLRRQETMGDTIAQTSLKRRVKKLEQKKRSRTYGLKRLYKVSLTAKVESSRDDESLGEDASKHGRINAIDADEDITLVND